MVREQTGLEFPLYSELETVGRKGCVVKLAKNEKRRGVAAALRFKNRFYRLIL